MRILAIDTCLATCSAALVDDGRVLAAISEQMARGHQERLAPLVQALMGEAGAAFDSLDRVGVTVGPGSFTGLRVGLAFAKGLGAALSIPVVGVGVLEALAAPHAKGAVVAAVDARRGLVYWQRFEDGLTVSDPAVSAIEEVSTAGAVLVGPGAPLLGSAALTADPDPVAVARLAARDTRPAPPRPLYLRAPDAKIAAP